MAELVIKIPKELEREVETWGVDLQPLFLTFLKREFNKIKRFESAVKESKNESELKELAGEMDEEVLWIFR